MKTGGGPLDQLAEQARASTGAAGVFLMVTRNKPEGGARSEWTIATDNRWFVSFVPEGLRAIAVATTRVALLVEDVTKHGAKAMVFPTGKYDPVAEELRQAAGGECGIMLAVQKGNQGTGASFVNMKITTDLAELLVDIADEIERETRGS